MDKEFTSKLRLLFLPFIYIAICIVAGYTLLNWLLLIKLHIFSIKEDVVNFWIPFALPWIPILLYLKPGLKLLALKTKKGSWMTFYIMISGLAIIAPTIIAQSYIETASGKLTNLDNITRIQNKEATKYYNLKNYYFDKSRIGIKSEFEVSGRYNENFNMRLFVAVPIFNSSGDTLSSKCFAWYGIKYQKQINNHLSNQEKEIQFKEFVKVCQMDFDSKRLNQFVYLERLGNSNDHDSYISAIKSNKTFTNYSPIVLIPVDEPFANRNGNKLAWIFGLIGIGIAVWFLMISIPKLNKTPLKEFKEESDKNNSSIKDVFGYFLPKEGFYITPILMDLNIFIFILMVFSGLGFVHFKIPDLLAWGANFRPYTTNGQWWRLLTNIFVHEGIMHLFGNIYGLLIVGVLLEPKIGKTKYLAIYLISGIVASLTSLWWHTGTVSIGASGAIFGLYGTFLALLIMKVFPPKFSKAFLFGTVIFIAFNLLAGLSGGIDNAAHIGGLICGFGIGLFLVSDLKREAEYQKFVEEAEAMTKEIEKEE